MDNLKKNVDTLEAIGARVHAAVDAWYAKHFHRSVVQGTAAISSAEKDELHRVVASAVQPQQQPAPAASVSASERD